jgi:hypothetical protein
MRDITHSPYARSSGQYETDSCFAESECTPRKHHSRSHARAHRKCFSSGWVEIGHVIRASPSTLAEASPRVSARHRGHEDTSDNQAIARGSSEPATCGAARQTEIGAARVNDLGCGSSILRFRWFCNVLIGSSLRVVAALDDFRNWLALGLQPAKAHENRRGSEWRRRERRDRIEPVEPSRPSNCLIRSVRD